MWCPGKYDLTAIWVCMCIWHNKWHKQILFALSLFSFNEMQNILYKRTTNSLGQCKWSIEITHSIFILYELLIVYGNFNFAFTAMCY